MGANGECQRLILLVGSNPLPNYIAAMMLKPDRIHLVFSEETKSPKQRLAIAIDEDFRRLGHKVDLTGDAYVADATSAKDIRRKIAELITTGGVTANHLHYTGGTKVMAAHALNTFYKNGGRPENATYIDEGKGGLRFDDGRDRDLDCQLGFDRILQLHGVKAKSRSNLEGGPMAEDAEAIVQAVCQDPSLASRLYKERKRLEDLRKPSSAIDVPFKPSEYGLSLSVPKVPPDDEMAKKAFEQWYKFIGGEWLEEWVALKILSLGLSDVTEESVSVGVNGTRLDSGRPFEVDVAVIRGHRSYFISCTTDATLGRCKSKAFEIAARARQMGGDLARSATVFLLHGSDSRGTRVEQLQADIDDAWGAANTTKIFGYEDLRAWAGHDGAPDLTGLKKWLES